MIALPARRDCPGPTDEERTTTLPLSGKDKRALRARAHHLNPVVTIGAAGVSDAVLAELHIALEQHELVKLRIAADDREQRAALIAELCEKSNAELIQRIGHTAVLFRKRADDREIKGV